MSLIRRSTSERGQNIRVSSEIDRFPALQCVPIMCTLIVPRCTHSVYTEHEGQGNGETVTDAAEYRTLSDKYSEYVDGDPVDAADMAGTVLRPGDGSADDDAAMLRCASYDYKAQRWLDYSDHAHALDDSGPLMFCGADLATCAPSAS